MEGVKEDRGINYRTLGKLFELSALRAGEIDDTISLSILEIYNETIRDLLVDKATDVSTKKLEARQGPNGMTVPGLTMIPVTSLNDVIESMDKAKANRSQACTDMNAHSSRSHCMLSIHVSSFNNVTSTESHGKV